MSDMLDEIQEMMKKFEDCGPPLECHTTPTGWAAMRALFAISGWAEVYGRVTPGCLGIGQVTVYEDPDLTGSTVEFRTPDGAVQTRIDMAPFGDHKTMESKP